ncbi:MAG: hypothetical protein QM751_03860 [Paludibacteraceae bacterium]
MDDCQWIAASIIPKEIKKNSNIPIVGYFKTKSFATLYVKYSEHFDFALLDENKETLYHLCRAIENSNENTQRIPNIIYKNTSYITDSSDNFKDGETSLLVMRSQFDYSDYIKQVKLIPESVRRIYFPIHFETANYKTRFDFRKDYANNTIKTLKYLIKKFKINQFIFPENDVIDILGKQLPHYLNELIKIKDEYSDFSLSLENISTKGLNKTLIRKMSFAGIKKVRLKYYFSNSNKANSFASNLLFTKFAIKYDIHIKEADFKRNLSKEEILKSIDYTHMLRFYVSNTNSMALLNEKNIQSFIDEESENIFKYLPQYYSKFKGKNKQKRGTLFSEKKEFWDTYTETHKHYIQNVYSYKLVKNNSIIFYREYINNELLKEIEFEIESLELFVFISTNEQILSFPELFDAYHKEKDGIILELELISVIEELKRERLIYASDDFTEILSLIDINIIV